MMSHSEQGRKLDVHLLQGKVVKQQQLLPHVVHLAAHERVLLIDFAEGGAEGEVLHHLPSAYLNKKQNK